MENIIFIQSENETKEQDVLVQEAYEMNKSNKFECVHCTPRTFTPCCGTKLSIGMKPNYIYELVNR